MHFWLDIAAFALKALILVVAVGGSAALIARAARGASEPHDDIEIERLDEIWRRREARFGVALAPRKQRRSLRRAARKAAKAPPPEARIYVLDFEGDVLASSAGRLGREIDAVLGVARAGVDEVVLRLKSSGGTVTGYGLAAAQLQRLRAAKVKLTACVDEVAASGGYMMAAMADTLRAAPFALIGSIGVVAQIPNVSRVLKKNDIDFEVLTAGEFKRSVSVFGEITPAGRAHFQGKLEETHDAFKALIAEWRPKVDVARVGDGDVWLARDAQPLGLVDEIGVSGDYLFARRHGAAIYLLKDNEPRPILKRWLHKFGFAARLLKTAL